MKTLKLVLKAILLYITMFTGIVIVAAIDSLYEQDCLFTAICILISLIYVCWLFIDEKDFNKILKG